MLAEDGPARDSNNSATPAPGEPAHRLLQASNAVQFDSGPVFVVAKKVAFEPAVLAGLLCCPGMAQQRTVSPEDHTSQPSAPGSGEGSFHKGSGQKDGQGPLSAGRQQQQAVLECCNEHDRKLCAMMTWMRLEICVANVF